MNEADPQESEFAGWIGRRCERIDIVSPRLAESFRATLAPHLAAQAGTPLGVFWCFAPDIVEPGDLGSDGHPRTGIFLPALPYSRRMWAGGELAFHGVFAIGDSVTKTSTIEKLVFKTGATGKLAFLTIRHDYEVGERLMLHERQDVVYRDAAGTGSRPPNPPKAAAADAVDLRREIAFDPALLFRYSALTFNGHRIHYDRPYATEVEGYDGLVVHGPLQATLLLNVAAEMLGGVPRRFSYRGQAPLICGGSIRIEAVRREDAGLALRVVSPEGTATMIAEADAETVPVNAQRSYTRSPGI